MRLSFSACSIPRILALHARAGRNVDYQEQILRCVLPQVLLPPDLHRTFTIYIDVHSQSCILNLLACHAAPKTHELSSDPFRIIRTRPFPDYPERSFFGRRERLGLCFSSAREILYMGERPYAPDAQRLMKKEKKLILFSFDPNMTVLAMYLTSQ